MAGNTFGQIFRVTTFGESHGEGLGCIVDGCPAGLPIDRELLQHELDRRKPGAAGNVAVTSRREPDTAQILSGVFEEKTTGTPIAILIANTNQHSKDYGAIKDCFRPGHADFSYQQKYGIRDYRGGGRSSGRETSARVAAGAIAKMLLRQHGISITAYTKEAAGIACTAIDESVIEQNPLRAADAEAALRMQRRIEELRSEGDSAGGIVECVVRGVQAGLGEPVFDKLDAVLAQAIMSIGAVKGIEFGSGFSCARMTGKEHNDAMRSGPLFQSNNAGGILGGISRGDDIVFRLAIKPVPSIFMPQKTITAHNEDCDITIEGRHDACLCPRVVPVVEAMTAIVLADLYLRDKAARM